MANQASVKDIYLKVIEATIAGSRAEFEEANSADESLLAISPRIRPHPSEHQIRVVALRIKRLHLVQAQHRIASGSGKQHDERPRWRKLLKQSLALWPMATEQSLILP